MLHIFTVSVDAVIRMTRVLVMMMFGGGGDEEDFDHRWSDNRSVLCLAQVAGSKMATVRNCDVADWRLADEAFLASFRLPTAADKCELLAGRNPFPREHRIAFHEQ